MNAGKASRRLGRYAGQLGLDRNPLRRPVDRIEAITRLVVVILLLVGIPVAAIAAGRAADYAALRHVEAQRTARHQVTAVLLAPAAATGVPDPYTWVQMTWTPARWQAPGHPAETGEVLVTAGTPKGSTVATWISASGSAVTPPEGHRDVVGDVWVAVVMTCLVFLALLLGLQAASIYALDRWRLRSWEDGWRSAGPLWSSRRS